MDGREEGKPKILADSLANELTAYMPMEANGDRGNKRNDRPLSKSMAEARTQYEAPLLSTKSTEPVASPSRESASMPVPEAPPAPDDWVTDPDPLLFILPRNNDLDQDIQRLKAVYRLLEESPGGRRFELCIPQNGHGVLIEYPLSIHFDNLLRERLTGLGVKIEEK